MSPNKTKQSTRFASAAAVRPQGAPPERLSPVVHHLMDRIARDAIAGDREAIETVARELRDELVDHAHAHLGRFDCDAEDVVQDLLLAMLDKTLPLAPKGQGIASLLALVASMAGRRRR